MFYIAQTRCSSVHVNQAFLDNSGSHGTVEVRLGLCSVVRSLWGRYRKNSRKRDCLLLPRSATPAPNCICHMTTALARRLRNKTESTNQSLTMYFMRFNPRFTNKYYRLWRHKYVPAVKLNVTTTDYLQIFAIISIAKIRFVTTWYDSTNLFKFQNNFLEKLCIVKTHLHSINITPDVHYKNNILQIFH